MSSVAAASRSLNENQESLDVESDGKNVEALDSFSDDGGSHSYYYVLAPESDCSSVSVESIADSIQEKSTDWVKDSSDLTSSSIDSRDILDERAAQTGIEFEVVSVSEGEVFYLSDGKGSSSGPDVSLPNRILGEVKTPKDESAASDSAQTSDHESDRNRFSSRFKFCVRCKDTNPHPYFKYCSRCQKMRRDFLPERPKRRKVEKSKREESYSSDEGIGKSFEVEKKDRNVCPMCNLRPKDGGFTHGLVLHIYGCYKCCVKLNKVDKNCPVCHFKTKAVKCIKYA